MDTGKVMSEIREALGIKPQSVWKIEKNKSFPKPKTIEKFCEVAKIPLAYFYAKAMTREDYTVK